MKRAIKSFIVTAALGLLLAGCGKSEKTAVSYLDENTFQVFDKETVSYSLSVETRKDSAIVSKDTGSFVAVFSTGEETGWTDAFYGTFDGGRYFQTTNGSETVTYLNDGYYSGVYTKDEYPLVYTDYDAMIREFLTYENLKDAKDMGESELKLKNEQITWRI